MKVFKMIAPLGVFLFGISAAGRSATTPTLAVTSSPAPTMRSSLTPAATRRPTRIGTTVPTERQTIVSTAVMTPTVVPTAMAEQTNEATLQATIGSTPEIRADGTTQASAGPTAAAAVDGGTAPTAEETVEGVLSEVTPTPVVEESPESQETSVLTDQALSIEPTSSVLPTETPNPEATLAITETGTQAPTEVPTGTPTVTATVDLSIMTFASPTMTLTATEEPSATPTLTLEPANLSVEDPEEENADIHMDSTGAYDSVERMGAFLSAQEWQTDGTLVRIGNADILSQPRRSFALKMEEGVLVKKGDRLTLSRKIARVKGGALPKDGHDLYVTIGVLKVIKTNEEGILAISEKLYSVPQQGDLMRLREPLRKAFLARYGRATKVAPLGLSGQIVANGKGNKLSQLGGWSYIDQGANLGLVPGMKLELYRPARVPANGKEGEVEGALTLGVVEVADVSDHAAAVRIIKSKAEVRVGDKVRSRLAP